MQFQITALIASLLVSPILAVPVTGSNEFVARSVAAIRSADEYLAVRQCTSPSCAGPACVPTKIVPPGENKGAFCASLDLDTFDDKMKALWYCC